MNASETDTLYEIQRLSRRLLEPVKGHDTIGGFHVKRYHVPHRYEADMEWLIRSCDLSLQIRHGPAGRDYDKMLIVEFNGFGDISRRGSPYKTGRAYEVLKALQRLMILDVLADV